MKTHVIDSYFDHNAHLEEDQFMSKCGLILPKERFFQHPPDWCKNCSPGSKKRKVANDSR